MLKECENCKKQCDCKQREAYKRLAELGNAKCSGYEPDTDKPKNWTERMRFDIGGGW